MIILDSDHLTALKYSGSDRYRRLTERLAAANDTVGTTIINAEEQLRGWLAVVAKERNVFRQTAAYRELTALFEFFHRMHVLEFTEEAANRFQELRGLGIKLGAMDLKISCIAILNNALLLTANQRDFAKVPGLRFENWID